MTCSEITLREAIEYIDQFCPIKIVFNNIVLYNDYDSDIVIETTEDGGKIYGEYEDPLIVVPDRLWLFEYYIVTSIKIDIVQHHHSIVTMEGYFKERNEE